MQLEAQTTSHLFDSDADAPAAPARRSSTWRAAGMMAGLLAATAVLTLGVGGATRLRKGALPGITELDEDTAKKDPCAELPYLRIQGIKSNNLGGMGPDKDKPEGIIYETSAHHIGANRSDDYEVHIHAVSEDYFAHSEEEGDEIAADYHPEWPKVNGVKGHFATINVHPGTNVTVQLIGFDATLGQNVSLPRFALTFFDLDTGKDGTHCVEYLRINNFKKYFITNETELEVRKEPDGSTKFSATVEGSGSDNPIDPLQLTPLQKNRAVSFEFEDQKEIIFEVGASPGASARVFQFVVRPIMRCSYTKLPGGLLAADDPNSPITLVEGSGGEQAGPTTALTLGLALLAAKRWL